MENENNLSLLHKAMELISMAKQRGKPVVAWPDGSITILELTEKIKNGKAATKVAIGRSVKISTKEEMLPLFQQDSWTEFGSSGKLPKKSKEDKRLLRELKQDMELRKDIFCQLVEDESLPVPLEVRKYKFSSISCYQMPSGFYFADAKKHLVEYVDNEGSALFDSLHLFEGFKTKIKHTEKSVAEHVEPVKHFKPIVKTFDEQYPMARMFRTLHEMGASTTPEEDIEVAVKASGKPVVQAYLHMDSMNHVLWHDMTSMNTWLATNPEGFVEVWKPTPMTQGERELRAQQRIQDKLK